MSNSFFRPFLFFILIIICFIIFIPCLFIPDNNLSFSSINSGYQFDIGDSDYVWPSPGYTSINSYFGKRSSPTAGASSYHKGIDIGAPEGSVFIAVASGKITYTGFLGGGGYTITLTVGHMKVTYCHVSPHFIVQEGQFVSQGDIIGFVGPKNVYGVKGNPYQDSNGNPTNGATTGPHLHLGIRVDNDYLDPLSLFHSKSE